MEKGKSSNHRTRIDPQINGWMSWGFTSLSTEFQSYQDDGRVNMKGSVQCSTVLVQKESLPLQDLNPQPCDPKSEVLIARLRKRVKPRIKKSWIRPYKCSVIETFADSIDLDQMPQKAVSN